MIGFGKDVRITQALELRDAGLIDAALAEFRSLADAQTDPLQRGLILLHVASCLGLLGDFVQARQKLNESQALVQSEPALLLYVRHMDACLDIAQQKLEDALNKLREIQSEYQGILDDPLCAELRSDILRKTGMLLVELGRGVEARPLLQSIIETGLADARVFCDLAECCYNDSEFSDAAQHFQRALGSGLENKHLARAYYGLGHTYMAKGAYAQALSQLERCVLNLQYNAAFPARLAYESLEEVCRKLGLTDDARKYATLARNA